MKNIIKAILFFTLIISVFSSCKKGEEDPFISLRTRTSRLTGDWKLTNADYNLRVEDGYNDASYHFSYEGIKMDITRNTLFSSERYSQNYNENLTFDKEGTFEQLMDYNSEIEYIKGHWYWSKKNKDSGIKNKEAIFVTYTKDPDKTSSGKSTPPQDIFLLKKLSNKELITEFNYTYTTVEGYKQTISGTKTYKKE